MPEKERKFQKTKFYHMITELLSILIMVPFYLYMAYILSKQNKILSNVFIFLAIITFMIDGYLYIKWLNTPTNNKYDMGLRTLVRQASRWANASQQDKSPLVATLHANYGAGYLWALEDISTPDDFIRLNIDYNMLKTKIVNIQDESTRNLSKTCPNFASNLDIELAKLGGEI